MNNLEKVSDKIHREQKMAEFISQSILSQNRQFHFGETKHKLESNGETKHKQESNTSLKINEFQSPIQKIILLSDSELDTSNYRINQEDLIDADNPKFEDIINILLDRGTIKFLKITENRF